jgi:hypothetical protein
VATAAEMLKSIGQPQSLVAPGVGIPPDEEEEPVKAPEKDYDYEQVLYL